MTYIASWIICLICLYPIPDREPLVLALGTVVKEDITEHLWIVVGYDKPEGKEGQYQLQSIDAAGIIGNGSRYVRTSWKSVVESCYKVISGND